MITYTFTHSFQEPGANASEIYATLKYIRPGDGFVPNFAMFAKTDVNGKSENPIYTFLKVHFSINSIAAQFFAGYFSICLKGQFHKNFYFKIFSMEL